MENILFWQVVTLIVGVSTTYMGVRRLRMSNRQFLAEWEETTRKNLTRDNGDSNEAVHREMRDIRKDPGTWRLYTGGSMLAAGIVSLFAFALLVLLDIGT
jgi:hypothetical protein